MSNYSVLDTIRNRRLALTLNLCILVTRNRIPVDPLHELFDKLFG